VLDLFAGTGALGIEALSRGAVSATFVDRSREAIAVISGNLERLGLSECASVRRWDIVRNLQCLDPEHDRFSLVFFDPPYGRGLIMPVLRALIRRGCLESPALLVIEHDAGEAVETREMPLSEVSRRYYGKTVVTFMEYML
jgi:16S rRNA (guanine966-N2)-methyltransferase